jgi:hypothetical protein
LPRCRTVPAGCHRDPAPTSATYSPPIAT